MDLIKQLFGTKKGAEIEQGEQVAVSLAASPIVQFAVGKADPNAAADITKWAGYFDDLKAISIPSAPTAVAVAPPPPAVTAEEVDAAMTQAFTDIGAPAGLAEAFEAQVAAILTAAGHALPT